MPRPELFGASMEDPLKRKLALLFAAAAALLAACGGGSTNDAIGGRDSAQAAGAPKKATAQPASKLLIPGAKATKVDRIDPRLHHATGTVEVWISTDAPSLAERRQELRAQQGGAANWKASDEPTKAAMRQHQQTVRERQDAMMSELSSLGARELGRVSRAHSAIAVRIDANRLPAVAALGGVARVRPVVHYELALDETVPYIGAKSAQQLGFDGKGVTVAVLDSGIDYTHRGLGGPGTTAAYEAAYNDVTARNGLFPTAKVVEGFDFVGESWPCPDNPDGTPNDCRTEDDDPIDFEGHGTHVADIIAGRKGVAPGAKLLAVKVCSAVATSCNGVALLKAVDFVLDPIGDGDLADAADVVNLSLGSSYGQKEDDLSAALANAVKLGVVVVASAGNSADRPYIAGSPSTTPEVISVAQTQVPSALAFPLVIKSPASIDGVYPNTATVDWAPINNGITGDVVFVGRGCNADPYLAAPAGKVALIDRGTCNISEKVRRASDAGATGVLVGLVAPGDAVTFSNGGQCPVPADGTCKPTLIITFATANLIKANIAAPVNVSVTQAQTIELVGSMVGSSSRGPSMSFSAIKPDIGAPGASVSALVGTGDGTEAFGGTSGAAPMVAGAAALLRGAYPQRTPTEIKAVLMNTAYTKITTNPATQPGALAPITRIGGGEVRALAALRSKLAAWEQQSMSGSLSFGYHRITRDRSFHKKVIVRNYGRHARTLAISPSFRYADDQALGAVSVDVPGSVTVPANGSASFLVKLEIAGDKLAEWPLDGGPTGGDGAALNGPEFDGYITLSDGQGDIHLAWQILPHKAASIGETRNSVNVGGSVLLRNAGVTTGPVDVFSLTGVSKKSKPSDFPQAGDSFALIDLRSVGVRGAFVSDGVNDFPVLQFAINTNGARAHPNYPAEFDIYIDADGDGVDDFVLYNSELGGFAVSGQNVVNLFDLAAGTQVTRFFADADLNSSNMIFTVLLDDLGLAPDAKFRFSVFAFDNYFTGALTDSIENMTYTAATPRYVGTGLPDAGVPAGGSAQLKVQVVAGGAAASPSQIGLLLMYRNQRIDKEAARIVVAP